jgi:hypothetical protein
MQFLELSPQASIMLPSTANPSPFSRPERDGFAAVDLDEAPLGLGKGRS